MKSSLCKTCDSSHIDVASDLWGNVSIPVEIMAGIATVPRLRLNVWCWGAKREKLIPYLNFRGETKSLLILWRYLGLGFWENLGLKVSSNSFRVGTSSPLLIWMVEFIPKCYQLEFRMIFSSFPHAWNRTPEPKNLQWWASKFSRRRN